MKTLWERLQSLSQEDRDRYKQEELTESEFEYEAGQWEDAEPSFSPYFYCKGNKVFAGFEAVL